jgi:hypothetical protein
MRDLIMDARVKPGHDAAGVDRNSIFKQPISSSQFQAAKRHRPYSLSRRRVRLSSLRPSNKEGDGAPIGAA